MGRHGQGDEYRKNPMVNKYPITIRKDSDMSHVLYRRRGTAIVETDRGILLTAGSHGPFILPGGGAEKHESRLIAALRELNEEAHLRPYYAKVLFRHKGNVRPTHSGKHMFQDQHTVCLIKATGTPRPGGGDAQRIAYYYPGCSVRISRTTAEILDRYYAWKGRQHPASVVQMTDELPFQDLDDEGDDLPHVEYPADAPGESYE